MRYGRILGIAAATVIVLAVAAVAVLPSVLDWNRYRGTLELLAGDALGRPVTIAGPVSLSLLPQPMLTASRVRVDGGGDGARILVAELRLRVALMPLLSGRVDASELTLRRPNLHLPWPPRLGLPFATPPWLAALSASIEDGEIEAGSLVLTHVNATLAAGRGNAALVLSGSAATGASSWQFDLRLSDPEADGDAPIEANLSGADEAAGIMARLVGALEPNGQIRGQVALEGPDLARLTAAPPLPFHVDGMILTGDDAVHLDGLALRLGGATAIGKGTLALEPSPRLNLVLTAPGTVPLDPWLTALRAGGESRLPVGLTLAATRATLARGLLRQVWLAAVFAPGGARIGAFQAILPGDANFAAEGQLGPAQGKSEAWQFVGTAHLRAPTLNTTAHWLEAAAPGVLPHLSPRVLGAADVGARVTIDESRIALEEITGTFDQNHVSGGLSLGLGGTPSINAGLTLDRLDLGAWLNPWLRGRPDENFPSLAALPPLLAQMEVELRLSVEQATLGQTAISDLSLDAAVDAAPGGSQVIVRRLDATVEGMHASAAGALGAGGVVTAGQLTLTAPGTEALAALLPAPFGSVLKHWRAPLSLDAAATGPPNALHLSLEATLGDLRVTADPAIDLQSGTWQGPVTLRHPGATELIVASGLPSPASWLGQGSFSLIGRAEGGGHAWALDDFRLIAGSLAADGSLRLTDGSDPDDPGEPAISGTVHANALPVPVPASDARELLPMALLTGWRGNIRFTAETVLAGPHAVLSQAVGRVNTGDGALSLEVSGNPPDGGAMTAVLSVNAKTAPPHFRLGAAFGGVHLAGGLFRTSLDLASGTISGQLGLAGEGYGTATLLATLSGSAELTGQNGVVSGVSLGDARAVMAGTGANAESSLSKALAGGTTSFTRISLAVAGSAGRFTLKEAKLTANDGTIGASGSVDLPDGTEDLRLALASLPAGSPDVVVRLAGPIARPRRLIETTEALNWLANKNQTKTGH